MTLLTFTPPRAPSLASSKAVKTRILTADFGDGYSQRAADGLNNVRHVWSLTWKNLSDEDADTIEAFFVARRGYQAFLWAAPGAEQATYICSGWERGWITAGSDSLSATFEQVFDLV
jgi:phage-related protein